MDSKQRQELIEVRRPPDLAQIEMRRGIADTRPVPRHWHEEYQFNLAQCGMGELRYRGENLLVPPASIFMIHPGEVHSNQPEQTGVSYRMMLVDAELVRRVAAEIRGKDPGLPFFRTALTFDQVLIQQYMDLHFALERPASSLERQALLLTLLTSLVSRFAEHHLELPIFGLENQAVKQACEYLTEHFAENVSLDDLACLANLSPFHFSRVFSQQVGMPPHAFQTQVRVARAKALLRQGWSIPQVASQTGFADQSHLSRHFKRLVTVTPGQYSKNVQDPSFPRC